MQQTRRRAHRPGIGTLVLALLAGLAVLLLLFPASVVTTDPPDCYAMLFYPVPCEAWVAPLAAAGTAGLIGWLLWRNDRRRQ